MKRRQNVQHGQKRRHPPGVLIPTLIILICCPLLIWELTQIIGAVIQ